MLREIRIQNFKSLEDTTVPLGRVTILIGENGGGKTNVVESIGLISAAIGGGASSADLVARGLRHSPPESAISKFKASEDPRIWLEVESHDDASRYAFIATYSKSGQWRATRADSMGWKPFLASLREQVSDASEDDLGDILQRFQQEMWNLQIGSIPAQLLEFVVYAPEAERLRTFMEEGQLRPLGARGEGLFRHLKELQTDHPDVFEKIVESTRLISWLDTIEIPSDLAPGERRLAIRDRHMLHELDQRSANEGFLFLLFIFTVMWSPETPKMFAIDNVDEALNPRLCREAMEQIVRIAKETGKQVILTTHNPALLDGLNLNDDEQVLVAVSRDADGRTRADRVPAPRVRKGSKPVRLSHAFVQGYLGGLPTNF